MTVLIAYFTPHFKFLVCIFSSFMATTLSLIVMQGLPFLCPSLKHWCSLLSSSCSHLFWLCWLTLGDFVHCHNFRFIIPQSFCYHSFCMYYLLCLFCISPLFSTWENTISPSRLSLSFNFRYTFSYPFACPLPLCFPSRLGATYVPVIMCIPSSCLL